MKLSYNVQKAEFDRKLAKAVKKMGSLTRDLVREGVGFFVLSAVKATPQTKNKKRKMDKLVNQRVPAGLDENGNPKFKKSGLAGIVFFRRPLRGKDTRGAWYFGKPGYFHSPRSGWFHNPHLTEPNRYRIGQMARMSKITHRGIGKAAWLFSAQRIGLDLASSFKPSPAVVSQRFKVAYGRSNIHSAYGNDPAFATIVNQAWGIDRYGKRAAAWALGKAGNRLLGWARAESRKRMAA